MGVVYFNVSASVECGQIFRWFKEQNKYYLVAKDSVFELEQNGEDALIETNSELSDSEIFNFLGLEHDLPKIYKQINKDKYINAAIKQYDGMRVFEQDIWESLISYICSSNSNIPNIHSMLNNLSKKYGDKIQYQGKTFYTYPTAKKIASSSVSEIQKCKLGFRSRYALETAKLISSGEFDLEALRKMKHEEAREKLIELPGIGYKVADCVSLFGLHNFNSFPVDVWGKRFMKDYYNVEPKNIQDFVKNYFGKYAGYAQEYLFYMRRTS